LFLLSLSYSCVSGRTKILYIAKEEEEEDGYNNQCKKKMHNIVSFGSDDLKASSRIFLENLQQNRINSQAFFFVIKLVKMAVEEFW
jgi:predicted RNA-binding protein